MIILDQFVKVHWNGNNRHIYEPLGYVFTKYGEEFEIHIKHLFKSSNKEVLAKCDFCDEIFKRPYMSLNRHNSNVHYCSDECQERSKNNGYTKEERLRLSLNSLIKLHKTSGKIPTVKEYEKYAKENKLTNRRCLEKSLNMNWVEICNTYLGEANRIYISREDVINKIKNFISENKRTPLAKEIDVSFNTYERIFGCGFQELVENMGYELSSSKSIRRSEEELLTDYLKLYHELGRLPFMEDLINCDYTATYSTYLRYFDSLQNIWDILELDYKDIEGTNLFGTGFITFDKNGEICRSVPEMMITNLFIDNELNYTKELMYKKVIDNYKKTSRMDWYLEDYNICVEYFGLFNMKYKDSDNRLGKYTRKSLNKIELCKDKNVILIDLYKEDLDNDLEGVKNKLNTYINFIEFVS